MAVVNVFLNAPQTQILDVNEKTSIIDAVKDNDDENDDFDDPDNDDDDKSDDDLISFCRFLVSEVFLVSSWALLLSRLKKNTIYHEFAFQQRKNLFSVSSKTLFIGCRDHLFRPYHILSYLIISYHNSSYLIISYLDKDFIHRLQRSSISG